MKKTHKSKSKKLNRKIEKRYRGSQGAKGAECRARAFTKMKQKYPILFEMGN